MQNLIRYGDTIINMSRFARVYRQPSNGTLHFYEAAGPVASLRITQDEGAGELWAELCRQCDISVEEETDGEKPVGDAAGEVPARTSGKD